MDTDYSLGHRQPRQNWFLRVLARIWRAIRTYFVVIGMLTTASSILMIVLLFRATEMEPLGSPVVEGAKKPAGKEILHLKLEGPIYTKSPSLEDEFLSHILGREAGIYLPELRSTLREAADDKQVSGLFIEIREVDGGLAAITELRAIIEDFKYKGKPVQTWFANGSNHSVYLASLGARVGMAPAGEMTLPGPMFTLTYFGEALKKLGVGVEVIRSGKYKSAFEPFVTNDPTPATLEMYESLEGDLRNHYVQVVSAGRFPEDPKGEEKVRGWFKRSVFTSAETKSEGIVDELLYLEEMLAKMETAIGASRREFDEYAGPDEIISLDRNDSKGPALGLIEATGEIQMEAGDDREGITPDDIHDRVAWALEDKEVKAVVLRVSSPGGSAVASDLIWDDISRLAAVKPVVVSMGDYAASGGYYISAPATHIVAEPTTITGSIGVIGMVLKFKEFREKYGLSFYTVTGSDRSSYLDPGKSLSDEDKALINSSIESTYATFVRKVAAGRHKTEAEIDAIAQGRVWTGQQALSNGLVDELGGMSKAFQAAKRLGGLDQERLYPIRQFKKKHMSLLECLHSPSRLAECFDQGGSILKAFGRSIATTPAAGVMEKVESLQHHVSKSPILAMWPGYFNIEHP